MTASPFSLLRRRLTAAGGHAVSVPWTELHRHGSQVRAPAAEIIETPFRHHFPGEPSLIADQVAFLDGTQHVELVGYVGTDPVVAAVIRAGVRVRVDRRTTAAVTRERRIAVARAVVLDAASAALAGHELVVLDDSEPRHPFRDLERAHAEVDSARRALEADVARTFRNDNDCWLIVDGPLAVAPGSSSDARMVGVVKTHGQLALDGDALDAFLTVPAGQRTSVFALRSRQGSSLHAWGLRLWPWRGHDLFHGLVRVEMSSHHATSPTVDAVSRWLLAERVPLASGPRADRLLYGVHDVGEFLRAQGAAR